MQQLVTSFEMLFVGDHNEPEELVASLESSNYQLGWRKLRRASVKYIESQVHGDPKDHINLDHSARIHLAAGNGSLILPLTLHVDTASKGDNSDLFQLCCKVHSHIFDEESSRELWRFVKSYSFSIVVPPQPRNLSLLHM